MDASEAARVANAISPKMAVPMHWGAGIVGTRADAERFCALCQVPTQILEPAEYLVASNQQSGRPADCWRPEIGHCKLVIALDLEAIELHRFVQPNARFASGNCDLVLRRVHPFQVWQQQAPSPP